jgi:probable phosphoglycerate mutase
MKKDLYIFRHGQTDWNKLKKIQGTIDIPLNRTGLEQAKNLLKYLKDKNIGVIYSSRLKRAWRTGNIVAKELGIEIIKNNYLHEVYWGDAQGKTVEEIRDEFGLEFDQRWQSYCPEDDYMKFPNGESKMEVRQRAVNTISKLSLESIYQTLGFSSHGFVLKQMIIACGSNNFRGLKNCEILHLEFNTNKYNEENPNEAFRFVERIKTI